MRIVADGRMATLLEVEQVIEWLEEKRLKLGGRERKYQSQFFIGWLVWLGSERDILARCTVPKSKINLRGHVGN